MATFTISTDTNIDALSGKGGVDTYNINGASLTIDQDTRHGLNTSTTTGYMGSVTPSATLGGNVKVEGRYIRLVYFTGGSGTVPAFNTTISKGSASGLLIGVYSNLSSAPLAPGASMPSSGYIKIKQWNSVSFTSGALTGITATCALDPVLNTYDRAGWIEIVGRGNAATSWVLNRLNNPTDPVCYGVPYFIGITDGNRSSTYQIPTNGVYQYHAGVFVETGTATNEWEFYPATSDTMVSTNVPNSATKGKWCKIDYTTGLVRFGHDGTNSSGGYCPPSGRRVAIGNIFMTGCDAATPAQNYYNATPNSRTRFITSNAGRVDVRWTSFNWGFASMTTGQYINFDHCGIVDNMSVSNTATPPQFTNGGIGCPIGYSGSNLSLATQLVGADFNKFVIGKSGQGSTPNSYQLSVTDVNDLNITDSKFMFSGARGATTQYALQIVRGTRINVVDSLLSYGVNIGSSTDINIQGGQYYNSNIPNDSAGATYAFGFSTLSTNCLVEDITIEDGDLPRTGMFTTTSSSSNIVFRNFGSRTSPIGTGVPDGIEVPYTRSTTTITVSKTNHGLNVGDFIMVTRTNSTAAITRTNYAITAVPDANTFTFTGLNGGNTSGKISYYMAQHLRIALLTNSDTVKFQNIHIKGSRTNSIAPDNTSQNIIIQNLTADFTAGIATVPTANNMKWYNSSHDTLNQSAQASVYGTHIRTGYAHDLGTVGATGVAWTRATSAHTVTSPDHGLYTGSRIQILDSSNPSSILWGPPQQITVLDKDTFLFTGANSGSTSGTLSYTTHDGIFFIDMNEPNEASASQVTVIAGTPLFTGAGSLSLPTVGDEMEWETPDWITDFTEAAYMLPALYVSGGGTQYHELYWDIDTGSGYSGVLKNGYIQKASGTGTSGSPTLTLTNTTGIQVGDCVFGNGISPSAKVLSIDSGTQVTLTQNHTSTVSGTIAFSSLPNITNLPADGFKMKIRIKTITANANPITFVRIYFNSDSDSRDKLYPQDQATYELRIRGIPTGATVAVYDSLGGELARDDNVTAGFFTYDYVHEGVDIEDVYYVVWHEDYQPFKSDPFDLIAEDIGVSYTAILDRVYVDTYDINYSIDFADKLIVMGSGETTYDVQGAYSYWKDQIKIDNNFTYDFAFEAGGNNEYDPPRSTPILAGLLNGWKIRPQEANHTLAVVNGILYTVGGGDPFVNTLGAYTVRVSYQAPINVLTVTSGSGVLPTDVTNIAEAVEDILTPNLDEILSNSDATQAKVNEL